MKVINMKIVVIIILLTFFITNCYSQDFSAENDSSLTVLRNSLVNLNWAASEVETISDLFSGDAFVNSDATEEVFKEKVQNAGIVHLATHTLIDDENPLYSKMVFSNDQTSVEDGFLNMYELYNMDLNADLVVLSACNTGYGKIVRGEGIMSMARGFIYAGCPSIVMSLWPVDDYSTSVLMKNFYNGLANGLDKDEALRQAKLEYIQNCDESKADPFYWAGFVEVGNTAPIAFKSEKNNSSWFLSTIGLLLGIIIISGKKYFWKQYEQ